MNRRTRAVLLMLGLIALTEIVGWIFGFNSLVDDGVFLLSLVAIAYAAFSGGLAVGALVTAILAVYTLHFVAPPHQLVELDAGSLGAVAVITALGLAMSWLMARIKAREEGLRAALEARARDLETRNRELTDANGALEAFGYVVSHDLKEPVRALENYLDAARETWPDDESRRFVEDAYRANERLSRLLQGLLAYSRASTSVAPARPLDIEKVVRADTCRAQWEPLYREREAVLSIDEGLPPVMGSEVILEQALANILLNAVRHHPRGRPHVRIRSEPAPPGFARIVIADDGPGFPQEVIERFEGLRAGRPATIKSGFGLAITHRAVQRLGGHIHLQNAAEGGGEVILDLPAAPREDDARIFGPSTQPEPALRRAQGAP